MNSYKSYLPGTNKPFNQLFKQLAGTTIMLLIFSSLAQAQISLNAVRVTAADPDSLSEFYQTVFGLKEVNRLNLPGGNVEIFLNFGETEADAIANPAAQVVIMQSATDPTEEATHVIFTVSDINAVAAAITAAGGHMERAPFEFGNSGTFLGMAKDPAGNHIEILKPPSN